MINQQLVSFINEQRNNYSDEAIREALTQKGWKTEDIDAAFVITDKPVDVVPETLNLESSNLSNLETTQADTTVFSADKLMGFSQLLRATITLLFDNLATIYGIIFVPIISVLLLAGLLASVFFLALDSNSIKSIAYDPTLFIVAGVILLVLCVGLILLSAWSQAALIFAIGNTNTDVKLKTAFKETKKNIFSFFWVGILTSMTVFGASLLFLIPGIIVGVYIFAGRYITILEDKKGLEAISMSKRYVEGHWTDIFGRLFVFIVLFILVSLISGIIPIVNIFSGIFLAPIFTIYSVLLYQNLKELRKNDLKLQEKPLKKRGFILLIVLGFLIIPIMIGSITLGAIMFSEMDKKMDGGRIDNLTQICEGINTNFVDANEPLPENIFAIEDFKNYKDPGTGRYYEYKLIADGDDFSLCADLNDHEEWGNSACVSKNCELYSGDPFGPDSVFDDLNFDPQNLEINIDYKDSSLNMKISDDDSMIDINEMNISDIQEGDINIDNVNIQEGSSTMIMEDININTESGEITEASTTITEY